MTTVVPQARFRAPRNLELTGLAGLGKAVGDIGRGLRAREAEELRESELARIGRLANEGASDEKIANEMINSPVPELAKLGLRERSRLRAQAQSRADRPRRISEDAGGRKRFVDDGSLVFPDAKPDPAKQFGKPPAGFRFTETGDLQAIPGGPADRKAEEQEAKEEKRQQQKSSSATVVVQDIDRALDLVVNQNEFTPTTGFVGGQLLSNIGGTRAGNLNQLLTTVKANAGFDRLQAMREASPTGGALGQVSNLELTQLNAAIGSLDQSQTAEQLADNLKRVKNIYLDIIHGPGDGPARETLTFTQTSQGEKPDEEGFVDLGGGVRMRRVK